LYLLLLSVHWLVRSLTLVCVDTDAQYFNSAGSRIFDVRVEDALVANDLDVFAQVGAATASVLEITRPCIDGAVSIELVSQLENPMLSALEVIFESQYQLVVTTLAEMYNAVDDYLAGSLTVPINDWDVSLLKNFTAVFSSERNPAAAEFNEDLNRWDTSNAETMWGLFQNARAFNGNIAAWQTARVETMDLIFDGALSFNGDISRWQTGSVKRFYGAFRGASSFNSSIAGWDVSSAQTGERMFLNCESFNQALPWNTSNMNSMRSMVR